MGGFPVSAAGHTSMLYVKKGVKLIFLDLRIFGCETSCDRGVSSS